MEEGRNWGGAREGSGRPTGTGIGIKRQRYTFSLTKMEHRKVVKYVEQLREETLEKKLAKKK